MFLKKKKLKGDEKLQTDSKTTARRKWKETFSQKRHGKWQKEDDLAVTVHFTLCYKLVSF